jgi:K+-transporting ATPase KdpF subunit
VTPMNLEYAIGIVLSILLTGYLGYALIRPERF